MIVSMTSVILSLLVSILELGAKARSAEQETMLQSFLPDLLIIADSSTSEVQGFAEIAELASLAAASIASRQFSTDNDTIELAGKDSFLNYLDEAEDGLLSDLPPIRARAMVQLRHRAIAISEQIKQENSIDSPTSGVDDLFRILLVCMKALNDKESYVYLAAIHTIVAVADSDPAKFVPIIGIALVTGFVSCEDNVQEKFELSLEQRTKLTESLVLIIRRRNTFYTTLPFLIDLLVLGLKERGEIHDKQDSIFIHDATHRYFVAGTYDDINSDNDDELENSLAEYWKELDLRVRTGGPLFETENADVVRSGMMIVVSDLVSVLAASVTARYATILISCCIDTLRLDASRPVRRAGAALARELYGALVREQDEFLEAMALKSNFDVVLAMAMVEGHEDLLFTVLQRIISRADHAVQVNGIERLHDPALNARCQEAIALRKNADQGGILVAGKIALEANQCDDSSFVARLLTRNNNTDNNTPMLTEMKYPS